MAGALSRCRARQRAGQGGERNCADLRIPPFRSAVVSLPFGHGRLRGVNGSCCGSCFRKLRCLAVVEVELVTGYLVAWALRKARRVGAGLDRDVDGVLDVSLERLHQAVDRKLGNDPAVEKLTAEAVTAESVSDRTRRRVSDAVAEAAEGDPAFGGTLRAVLAELARSAPAAAAIAGGGRAAAVGGDAEIGADHGGAAALTMGDVTIGAFPPDPSGPGRRGGRPDPASGHRRHRA